MNIIDLAIEMEHGSRDFYRQLARSAQQEGVRNIFRQVAEGEQRVIEKLRRLRAGMQNPEGIESGALIRRRNIFRSGHNLERGCRLADDVEAYRFAIAVQRRLQRLYQNAAKDEHNEQARRLLLRIAEEEAREIESLQRLFDFANAPNEFLAWGEFSNLDEFRNFGRNEG